MERRQHTQTQKNSKQNTDLLTKQSSDGRRQQSRFNAGTSREVLILYMFFEEKEVRNMVRQKTPKARESFTRDRRLKKSDACGPQTRCRARKGSKHERGRKRERENKENP